MGPHGGPHPPMGGPRPPMGGPHPPMGGPHPPMGGPHPPMGGPHPPMGGPHPPMGGPHPPMGGPHPPMGGPHPPMGGPVPPMGGPRPPMGGPVPPMGGPRPGPVPPAGGFPRGYPVFSGQMAPNMYFKPIWTPKREMKLQRVWGMIIADGRVGYEEIPRLLAAFHYQVSPYEAQWFYNTLDGNHDGRIDFPEVRAAMQQFVMTYPRMRNPAKMHKVKPYYQPGYNWRAHPGFPGHLGHLWKF